MNNQNYSDTQQKTQPIKPIPITIEVATNKQTVPIGTAVLMAVCALYFMVGAIDLIPDVIPILGEFDDAASLMLMLKAANRLGIVDLASLLGIDKNHLQ